MENIKKRFEERYQNQYERRKALERNDREEVERYNQIIDNNDATLYRDAYNDGWEFLFALYDYEVKAHSTKRINTNLEAIRSENYDDDVIDFIGNGVANNFGIFFHFKKKQKEGYSVTHVFATNLTNKNIVLNNLNPIALFKLGEEKEKEIEKQKTIGRK